MVSVKLPCVLLLCMLVAAPMATQAVVSCDKVVSSLSPCIYYLRNKGPLIPKCCAGVKAVNGAARTTADRQTTCQCLKNSASSIPGIVAGLVVGLPGKCGVNIPYKISPSTDCKSVR